MSGGRDKKIFMTDLKNPNKVQLVCNESAPVVKMVTTPDMSAIWVATSESSINCWVSKLKLNILNVILVICKKFKTTLYSLLIVQLGFRSFVDS